MIVLALLTLACCVRGRSRIGTTGGRLIWALAVFEAALLLHLPLLTAALMAVGAFAGMLLSHGHYYAMGRFTPNTNDWLGFGDKTWQQCACAMLVIGFCRGFAIALPLMVEPGRLLDVMGLSVAIAIAQVVAYSIPLLWSAKNQIMRAELLFGFFIGLALIAFA